MLLRDWVAHICLWCTSLGYTVLVELWLVGSTQAVHEIRAKLKAEMVCRALLFQPGEHPEVLRSEMFWDVLGKMKTPFQHINQNILIWV